MSRKKKTFFGESLLKNMLSFNEYVDAFVELCIATFEWDGLPDTVDARFIELALYNRGMAVYFKDDVVGDLCLQCIEQGKRDVYGVPIKRRAFSPYNHYQQFLDNKNSVIIYNNMLRKPSFELVQMYALRLWCIDRGIDVNVNAVKTPVLLSCDEKEKLTLLNLYKEYEGNAPVIFGDKSLSKDSITAIRTDAPYLADKLYQLKTQIWNEALTRLGIGNTNTQKKERLVSDEIGVEVSSAVACRLSRLKARQEGAEKINKMFKTNITVKFNEALDITGGNEDDQDMKDSLNQKEGDQNE